jgi:hypothetical protein
MNFHRFAFAFLTSSAAALAFIACDPTDTEAQCTALGDTAATELVRAQQGDLSCQTDSDCVWTPVNSDGWCAAACGGLTDVASAASYIDSAANLCKDYGSHGCTAPTLECPSSGPFLCASGTCALDSAVLSVAAPSSPITHGECSAFALDYVAPNGDTSAPHDIAVALVAYGGTLYADAACTTPLATGDKITIPSGAHDVAFGFEAEAAGQVSISVGTEFQSYVAQ